MPTGYTAGIADGITFNEYALLCARAFGATVTMRDEPMDSEIPEAFSPSSYYTERLTEITAELEKIRAMSEADAKKEAKKDFDAQVNARMESIRRSADLRSKYEAMLREVKAYSPPSPDHVEFKNFMRSQIEESMKWDCAVCGDAPTLESGRVWKSRKIQRLLDDIEYHERMQQEEISRTADRNRWVKQLRASLAS